MVEGEDRDAGGDEGDDQIFVEGEPLPEDCQVEEHDGQEFA